MLLRSCWVARVVLECVFVKIVGCLGFKALKWSARSRLNGWLCPNIEIEHKISNTSEPHFLHVPRIFNL